VLASLSLPNPKPLNFQNWIKTSYFGSDQAAAERAQVLASVIARPNPSLLEASLDVLDGIFTSGMFLCDALPRAMSVSTLPVIGVHQGTVDSGAEVSSFVVFASSARPFSGYTRF
jgi:hypothetical protein